MKKQLLALTAVLAFNTSCTTIKETQTAAQKAEDVHAQKVADNKDNLKIMLGLWAVYGSILGYSVYRDEKKKKSAPGALQL